jgi:tetratricopeptide (TPR) repeat protein
MLKATMFFLILGILATGAAIARYALLDDKLDAPRTEAERAVFLATQAVKADPNDAQARVKLAAAYLEMGKVNTAAKEAKIATRLAPDSGQAFYVLGLTEKEQGKLGEAAKSFEKAAKMDGQLGPFYQTCWLELAKVRMDQKDYKKAIKAYDEALDYGPESAPILYDMGVAYEKSGDKKTALAYYKETLEFIPDYEEALTAAKRLIDQGVTAEPTDKAVDNKTTANTAEKATTK